MQARSACRLMVDVELRDSVAPSVDAGTMRKLVSGSKSVRRFHASRVGERGGASSQ